jgi:dTDP-4-dehydrorhamnose reductase
MATLLVTGGTGQLAGALEAAESPHDIHLVGRPDFDFDHPDSIAETFFATTPALVINAAAYTAVDAAEKDAEAAAAADRANHQGPAHLAALCAKSGVPLIHVSTDYVFDGTKGAPYVETDPTAPQGVYGATKRAGEQAVLDSGARAVILRTSWVYAPSGRNFVRTMLNAGRMRDVLRVVADQKGCPTTATDLAAAILAIAERVLAEGWQDDFGGVFHAAGTGWTTWHGLACATFEQAAARAPGLKIPTVEAITTAEYPTPARRPADSRLDCAKLEAVFGLRLPPWEDGLARTIAAMDLAN